MISPIIEEQKKIVIDRLEKSNNLSDTDKLLYSALINKSAEGTNGLTQEQKIQNVSESLFGLMCITVSHIIEDNKPEESKSIWETIANTINDCKWAIVTIAGFLTTLLII